MTPPRASHPAPLASGQTQRHALRTIAAFEAFKGSLALMASLGFLGFLHQDLHQIAASLIGHIGLDPGGRYPSMLLNDMDRLQQADLRTLLSAAFLYVLVRFAEAFGLWNEYRWGEWLGALSGALYIPFELRHFLHQPTFMTAAVMGVNAVVVGFLAWQLYQRKKRSTG